jgi:transposase-like protein
VGSFYFIKNIFLDAYYEQVREDGQVRHLAVLVAVGINPQGKREILGVSVSLTKHACPVGRCGARCLRKGS